MVTGLPRTITVCSEEITEALKENAAVIVQAAKGVLERTPPELSADIIDRGVILTGGGALHTYRHASSRTKSTSINC